eukprot:s1708_g15.t1
MEEEQGSGAEWYDEWNQGSPDDWLNDDWSLEEQDWNGEWIGSVDDWSGDWSWFEDDWSSWPEDWSWNTQEWWNPTEAQPQSSNGAASSGSNIPQDTAKNEPPQNVSAVTVDSSDQSAPRVPLDTGGLDIHCLRRLGENAEQETEDRSAVKPKMLKVPGEPSENERRLHELTHLPDWCEHCVKSKGRQSHAVKKKSDRQPVIQIDFSFMATENDLPKRTILNATDVQTGYSMAVVLPSKGSVEKYAVAELRKFVFEIGRWRNVNEICPDWTFSE